MPYDAELAGRLNVALNEADVAGVIADPGTRAPGPPGSSCTSSRCRRTGRRTRTRAAPWCCPTCPRSACCCAEGLLRLADLAVERADGTPIPLTTFAEDGVRWWTRLHADDPHVSADAQRAAQPPPPWPNEPAT